MNRFKLLGSIILILAIFSSCKKEWEEHYYEGQPPSVDVNIWDTLKQIPDVSTFVSYMEQFELDTLFQEEETYTMFIPNNAAFESFLVDDTVTVATLYYHISRHFVQSGNIKGTEKLQMIAEKFVPFERQNNAILFDGIVIESESPLFLNGKYYILSEVANPKPSLFEYFELTNPILADYIESLDSIELDKELSRPIGFDDNGNTVYDTVLIITNEFEDDYFPVREEFRFKTATVVFPRVEDYNNALTVMASDMGAAYTDYSDIPLNWQNEYLIPYLVERGVFENVLSPVDFIRTGGPRDTLKLKNILGDSIAIEYRVADMVECSNGVAFNYENFAIPDTLYKGNVRVEMEHLAAETGINKFVWDEEFVTVETDVPYPVEQTYVATASNDSIVKILYNSDYNGTYTININVQNLFQRKYLMVVRANQSIGGIYNVYLNGNPIKTIDYYEEFYSTASAPYTNLSVTGKRYLNESGYRYWDAWAENDVPYGDAILTIEYAGPGDMAVQGLIFDYIDFIPYD